MRGPPWGVRAREQGRPAEAPAPGLAPPSRQGGLSRGHFQTLLSSLPLECEASCIKYSPYAA